MSKKQRKRIKKQLRQIANGARSAFPRWVVMDNFTCDLMLEAAKVIEDLERRLK